MALKGKKEIKILKNEEKKVMSGKEKIKKLSSIFSIILKITSTVIPIYIAFLVYKIEQRNQEISIIEKQPFFKVSTTKIDTSKDGFLDTKYLKVSLEKGIVYNTNISTVSFLKINANENNYAKTWVNYLPFQGYYNEFFPGVQNDSKVMGKFIGNGNHKFITYFNSEDKRLILRVETFLRINYMDVYGKEYTKYFEPTYNRLMSKEEGEHYFKIFLKLNERTKKDYKISIQNTNKTKVANLLLKYAKSNIGLSEENYKYSTKE